MKKLLLSTLVLLTIGSVNVSAGERMAKDTEDTEIATQVYEEYVEVKTQYVVNGLVYPYVYEHPVYYEANTGRPVPEGEEIYVSETIVDKYSNVRNKEDFIKMFGEDFSFKYEFKFYFPYDNSNTHESTNEFKLDNPLVVGN